LDGRPKARKKLMRPLNLSDCKKIIYAEFNSKSKFNLIYTSNNPTTIDPTFFSLID